MAELTLADGTRVTDRGAIDARLAPLGVHLEYWPLPQESRAQALLNRPALLPEEQEELLGFVEPRFQELKARAGYQTRDLIVLHADLAGLSEALARFAAVHYHEDDEVRYVLDGCGYFGFVGEGGAQMLLKVLPGDYINVPARAEHWFTMREDRRIKAVRYFTDKAGWVPVYTHTPVTLL